MSDIELMSCPFCGGKPSVRRSSGDERDGYAAHVSYVCSGCGCAKGACGDSGKGGYADNSTVEARAVESWNTRSGFTAIDMGTAAADGFKNGRKSVGMLLSKGFNTLETEGGKYKIVMQFTGHDDAWAAYTEIGAIARLAGEE